MSSLVHYPVSTSDTICNNQNTLLADIIRLSLLRIAVNFMVLKCVY